MRIERIEIPVHGTIVLPEMFFERLENTLRAVAHSLVSTPVAAMEKESIESPPPAAVATDASKRHGESAPPSLLNSKEAVSFLGVSARLLWSLTNCGELPCVRIGKCVRYDRHDLVEWINRQKRRARR